MWRMKTTRRIVNILPYDILPGLCCLGRGMAATSRLREGLPTGHDCDCCQGPCLSWIRKLHKADLGIRWIQGTMMVTALRDDPTLTDHIVNGILLFCSSPNYALSMHDLTSQNAIRGAMLACEWP